jgi:predicted nucleotidyltransferase
LNVPSIDKSVREEVETRLEHIASQEGVRILFACESGSRAWGFESADSDYDVRFLYVHPREWYLSVEQRRDVIERPIDDSLDLSGWDLMKALRLFRKSNPPLLEWLGSPIVYEESGQTASRLRDLARRAHSPRACAYHYLHMAQGNFREYLRGEEVWTKKYLYVLRPLLAIRWIERGLGLVPTEFSVMVEELVPAGKLKDSIELLLERKRAGSELARAPRIDPVSDFIEAELERHDVALRIPDGPRIQVADLDEVFLAALDEEP